MQKKIILIIIFIFSVQGIFSKDRLVFVNSKKIKIKEPSGLCISNDLKKLYCVSDKTGDIYILGFDGGVRQKIKYDGMDIEGISVDDKGDVYIVEEGIRRVVKISHDFRRVIRTEEIKIGKLGNNGLEGICVNQADGKIYLLNEKKPGLLLEYDKDFNLIESFKLNFAKDYSGIAYDSRNKTFWILSDESNAVYKWKKKEGVIKKYKIKIPKAEGIAVDIENNLVYIVSDLKERLYTFRIQE